MPRYLSDTMQRPGLAARLQRALGLRGRVVPRLADICIPVIVLDDLSKGDQPAIRPLWFARKVTVPAVVGQRGAAAIVNPATSQKIVRPRFLISHSGAGAIMELALGSDLGLTVNNGFPLNAPEGFTTIRGIGFLGTGTLVTFNGPYLVGALDCVGLATLPVDPFPLGVGSDLSILQLRPGEALGLSHPAVNTAFDAMAMWREDPISESPR